MQCWARLDFSLSCSFSMCTTAFLVSSFADSTLKSILSKIVPCSTTRLLRSLKIVAKSVIDLTSDWISSSRYFSWLGLASSYWKNKSSCCWRWFGSSSPWNSLSFKKCSFSFDLKSRVRSLSFSARCDTILVLICSSALLSGSWDFSVRSSLSLFFNNRVI